MDEILRGDADDLWWTVFKAKKGAAAGAKPKATEPKATEPKNGIAWQDGVSLADTRPTVSQLKALIQVCGICGGQGHRFIRADGPPKSVICSCQRRLLLVRDIVRAQPGAMDGAPLIRVGVVPMMGIPETESHIWIAPREWYRAHLTAWCGTHRDVTISAVTDTDVHAAYQPARFGSSSDEDADDPDSSRKAMITLDVLVIEIGSYSGRASKVKPVVLERRSAGKATWIYSEDPLPPKLLAELGGIPVTEIR